LLLLKLYLLKFSSLFLDRNGLGPELLSHEIIIRQEGRCICSISANSRTYETLAAATKLFSIRVSVDSHTRINQSILFLSIFFFSF